MVEGVTTKDITAVVLAGGRASRMGGEDKGLQIFCGLPLVLHALHRLRPQVSLCMISANRNLATYRTFGVAVWPDSDIRALGSSGDPVVHDSKAQFAEPFAEPLAGSFEGPLAGFASAMAHCQTEYLLTTPCDTPFFSIDLASRLLQGLQSHDADIAMAAQAGQRQPAFCLMKRKVLANLRNFMRSGGRKIEAWTATQHTAVIAFDEPHDDVNAFANANTLAELLALEKLGATLAGASATHLSATHLSATRH